jgi:hypothetical protein
MLGTYCGDDSRVHHPPHGRVDAPSTSIHQENDCRVLGRHRPARIRSGGPGHPNYLEGRVRRRFSWLFPRVRGAAPVPKL